LRVDDAVVVIEDRRVDSAGDVAVLIDGGTDNGASTIFHANRVVCTATKKGDAKRGF